MSQILQQDLDSMMTDAEHGDDMTSGPAITAIDLQNPTKDLIIMSQKRKTVKKGQM